VSNEPEWNVAAGMRDLCMHLDSMARQRLRRRSPVEPRVRAPVEPVLFGCVAVAWVPSVEFLAWLMYQPLDGLDVEPGDGGEVLWGAAAGEARIIAPRAFCRQCMAFAVASQTLVRSSS
jgi:hypothetical protein